jgi:hypothetical protein
MNRIPTIAILAALFVSGCATEQAATKRDDSASKPAASGQGAACVTNFSVEGGFWSGKKFSTFEEFPRKSMSGAFDTLLSAIATGGYQIVSSNKESGLISANQMVTFGQGKSVPLNASITRGKSSGIRVDLVFSLSGALITSTDGVQEEFCKLLAKVAQSPDEPVASPAPDKQPITPTKAKTKK